MPGSFLEYLRSAQLRYYQERDLAVDLCHSGWGGLLVAALTVATLVVFLLAIFHIIPGRKHVTLLLCGLGLCALAAGLGTTYWNWSALPAAEVRIFRDASRAIPSSEAQKAAVVALPLVLGGATLITGLAGCLYMAVFWATNRGKAQAGSGTGK